MAKKSGNILVIDDDKDVLYTAKLVLKNLFEKVVLVEDPETIPELMERLYFDVIILDMNFRQGATDGKEGMEWMSRILGLDPDAHIIINTAYGDVQLAVDAMKKGAIDFIVKPWEKEKLEASVNTVYALSREKQKVRKLENRQAMLSQDMDQAFGSLVTSSSAMEKVFNTVDKVAKTDADVLILGENGTGKELIAREIHRRSNRASQPLIKVDLGSVVESLFESELFGHKKGAFTDAKEDRIGRFEAASGGSLFLDEIGNLPPTLQAKLLTTLQSRQVLPVGSNKAIDIDVRLISATNMPIHDMVDRGEFRSDLLYRINTVEIYIPPLRQRSGDITAIAEYYLQEYAEKYGKLGLKMKRKTAQKLESYSWPGNVRELQHAVERAVILAEEMVLEPEDFVLTSERKKSLKKAVSYNMDEMEKSAIENAIDKWEGNLSKAALELGWGRSTLYRKMKKYGL